MSDVEQGGGTVFTAINISLWPRKGSAAFWYNLKPNGEGDFKTRHAACPVLTGSKWGIVIFFIIIYPFFFLLEKINIYLYVST